MVKVDFSSAIAKMAPVIYKVDRISDKLSMVTASYQGSPKDLDATIFRQSKGKLSVAPGTIRPVTGYHNTYRFGLVSSPDSMDMSDANLKAHDMTLIDKDTYVNKAQEIWSVVGDESNRRLVRKAAEEVSEILDGIPSMKAQTIPSGVDRLQKPENCSFVSYVEKDTGELRFGYLLMSETAYLVIDTKGAEVPVMLTQIVDEVANLDAEAKVSETANLSQEIAEVDMPRFIAYIRRILGYNSAYCDKYVGQIREISSTYNSYWVNHEKVAA